MYTFSLCLLPFASLAYFSKLLRLVPLLRSCRFCRHRPVWSGLPSIFTTPSGSSESRTSTPCNLPPLQGVCVSQYTGAAFRRRFRCLSVCLFLFACVLFSNANIRTLFVLRNENTLFNKYLTFVCKSHYAYINTKGRKKEYIVYKLHLKKSEPVAIRIFIQKSV